MKKEFDEGNNITELQYSFPIQGLQHDIPSGTFLMPSCYGLKQVCEYLKDKKLTDKNIVNCFHKERWVREFKGLLMTPPDTTTTTASVESGWDSLCSSVII